MRERVVLTLNVGELVGTQIQGGCVDDSAGVPGSVVRGNKFLADVEVARPRAEVITSHLARADERGGIRNVGSPREQRVDVGPLVGVGCRGRDPHSRHE